MGHVCRGLTTAAVVALSAVGPAVDAGADAAPMFNGSYTAVSPERTSTWIVSSSCAFLGCTASVVSDSLHSFTMLYDGARWNQLAVPHTGTCDGATVPASAAAQSLVPQRDGSLTGAVTTTVQCDGAAVSQSLPLRVTPLRP